MASTLRGEGHTEANALLRKSYLALYGTKQPTAGVGLTARAAAVSRNDSHVITGLAQLHRAEAHAMLGQARDCFDALGIAEDHFASIDRRDPAAALFCPSHHARLAGSCWLSLSKPADAITAFRGGSATHRRTPQVDRRCPRQSCPCQHPSS
ncbi:hypothetical protein MCBG_02216 [Micromonospora sp. M42]|nr:hypothetical protein MCBG_02216 [Micromonospora sp. M42]